MSDFFIKQNDTSPAMQIQFLDGDGDPVSISGGTVKFKMSRFNTGEKIVDSNAIIANGEIGIAYYLWNAADTAQQGVFKSEFEVTYSDGYVETFPNDGYITIDIREDLD